MTCGAWHLTHDFFPYSHGAGEKRERPRCGGKPIFNFNSCPNRTMNDRVIASFNFIAYTSISIGFVFAHTNTHTNSNCQLIHNKQSTKSSTTQCIHCVRWTVYTRYYVSDMYGHAVPVQSLFRRSVASLMWFSSFIFIFQSSSSSIKNKQTLNAIGINLSRIESLRKLIEFIGKTNFSSICYRAMNDLYSAALLLVHGVGHKSVRLKWTPTFVRGHNAIGMCVHIWKTMERFSQKTAKRSIGEIGDSNQIEWFIATRRGDVEPWTEEIVKFYAQETYWLLGGLVVVAAIATMAMSIDLQTADDIAAPWRQIIHNLLPLLYSRRCFGWTWLCVCVPYRDYKVTSRDEGDAQKCISIHP